MRHRLALEQHAPRRRVSHRRPVGIVQQPLHQVRRGHQVLQALLVLYADDVAPELVGYANRGDVHLALAEDLVVRKIGLRIRAGDEAHALRVEPLPDAARFVVGNAPHGGVERGLAEAFFEHAGRLQQFVRDDGVVHAHAALVEDAHDGLVFLEIPGHLAADLRCPGGQFQVAQASNVAFVMNDGFPVQPAPQPLVEKFVLEITAPQRAVFHARFGQRCVQVQHPDESGPLTAPVRDGEDRPAMGEQAGENMMAVLPDRFDHDQRRAGRNLAEHLHSVLLAIDKSVTLGRVVRMAPFDLAALAPDRGHDALFSALLCLPALLVGRQPQISACYNDHFIGHDEHCATNGGGRRGP